jgi:hypothetical protein
MSEQEPEAGARSRVETAGGEGCAVGSGLMWASENGSRLIDASENKSWKAAEPLAELTVTYPDGVEK